MAAFLCDKLGHYNWAMALFLCYKLGHYNWAMAAFLCDVLGDITIGLWLPFCVICW